MRGGFKKNKWYWLGIRFTLENTSFELQGSVTKKMFYLMAVVRSPYIRMTLEHLEQALLKFADPTKSYLEKYLTGESDKFISNPCFPLMHCNKDSFKRKKLKGAIQTKNMPFVCRIASTHEEIADIDVVKGNPIAGRNIKPNKFIGDLFSLVEAYRAVGYDLTRKVKNTA